MNKYIILNGTELRIIERDTLKQAITTAQNICDHSKEVIVRKVTDITDHTYIFENVTA